MIRVVSAPLFTVNLNRFATRWTVDTIDRSVDDTRVTSFFIIEIVRVGSRILPRKHRHFQSPGSRDRWVSLFRDGRTHLDRARSGRYSRSCLLGSAGTTFRAASLIQLSTLKSSLWRAGNSRCGCDRLNFASASMCSSEISRSCGIFARIASHTVTSPLIGVTWFRSNSDLNALITACDSLLMSPRHFSPGRSAQDIISQLTMALLNINKNKNMKFPVDLF